MQSTLAHPRYLSIRNAIARDLDDMSPGDRLPSEAAYCARFSVSRMTVSKALGELVRDGRIVRVAGMGTFVAQEKPAESSIIRVRDIADEIAERGGVHQPQVLAQREIEVDARTARLLDVPTGARLFHLTVRHAENGAPVLLEDRVINPLVGSDFLEADFTRTTAHAWLQARAPLTEFEHSIEAVSADPALKAQLDLPDGAPCLRIRRRTWSGPVVCSMAHLHYATGFRLTSRMSV